MSRLPDVVRSSRPPLVVLAVVCLTVPVVGAEIRVRSEARPTGSLVVLGDVADVYATTEAERQRLLALPLFPAPSGDRSQYVRVNELRDRMRAGGENLGNHRFSGAAQVKLISSDTPEPTKRSIPTYARRQIQEELHEAILHGLQQLEPNRDVRMWRLDLSLDDRQVDVLRQASGDYSLVLAGQSADGEQMWNVQTAAGDRLSIRAHLSETPRVVAVTRAIHRGARIHAEDVKLVAAQETSDATFNSLEDVIGQEATQALTAGQIVTHSQLQRPTLVERGQAVTVFARTSGITVRTTARAQENGALGDLVAVESLADRARFFARVSGPQEVEVFARTARSQPAATAGASTYGDTPPAGGLSQTRENRFDERNASPNSRFGSASLNPRVVNRQMSEVSNRPHSQKQAVKVHQSTATTTNASAHVASVSQDVEHASPYRDVKTTAWRAARKDR